MRIAIADDSDLLRDRIRNALTEIKNIEIVGEAKNGLEAMQLLTEKNPDCLILDLGMPEMNGIDVLIKGKLEVPGCKICILTGYSDKMYKEKCLAEGADYFFDKNLEFRVMIRTLNDLASITNFD